VNVHRVLSEMFAEALRWGVIATNPAAGICPLGVPRPKLHVPHQQTCGEILRRVHGRQVGESVVLAIGIGMRLGEILGRIGRRWTSSARCSELLRRFLRRRRVHVHRTNDLTRPSQRGSAQVHGRLPAHCKEQSERKMASRDVRSEHDTHWQTRN
jgi:hypothetical protein